MIYYIQGQLAQIDTDYVVVEAGGIGYQIFVANPFQWPHKEGEEIRLYTYHHVREDTVALYGFLTLEERQLFTKLLGVTGIGPKGALAIVAQASPREIILAIQHEDEAFLTQFPGVGKRTAQRLIVDLKDKLDDLLHHAPPAASRLSAERSPQEVAASSDLSPTKEDQVLMETEQALIALGYGEAEVRRILPELREQLAPEPETEAAVKLGLKLLMR